MSWSSELQRSPVKPSPLNPDQGAFSDDPYDFAKGSSYPNRRRLESYGSRFFRALKSCLWPEADHQPLHLDHPQQHDCSHETNNDVSISSVSSRASKASTSKWQFRIYTQQQQGDERGGFRLSYSEIVAATCNFSSRNEIGRGGFGVVYKGILNDGTVVAVKRGSKKGRDEHLSTEFKSEIQALSSVEHLSLVRFFGYLESRAEWIVVVEYVSNGNLREHLDGKCGNGLELAARLDIATDVAHAITYLHTYTDHPIIHRDIKPSNILLTENLRAKVTDFGFARFASDDPMKTHISTQVKGTFGYIDPDYVNTNQLTAKSDVYSFGVVLVELMTGRRPIQKGRGTLDRVTVRWAMKKLRDGDADSAMDPNLMKTQASTVAVKMVLGLASKCVMAGSRDLRPSMAECADALWAIRRNYRESEDPRLLHPSSAATPSLNGVKRLAPPDRKLNNSAHRSTGKVI